MTHGRYVQVLVRWALQHGTAVVPRASGEAHLRSNLEALDWELPLEDFQALSSFEFQVGSTARAPVPSSGLHATGFKGLAGTCGRTWMLCICMAGVHGGRASVA